MRTFIRKALVLLRKNLLHLLLPTNEAEQTPRTAQRKLLVLETPLVDPLFRSLAVLLPDRIVLDQFLRVICGREDESDFDSEQSTVLLFFLNVRRVSVSVGEKRIMVRIR